MSISERTPLIASTSSHTTDQTPHDGVHNAKYTTPPDSTNSSSSSSSSISDPTMKSSAARSTQHTAVDLTPVGGNNYAYDDNDDDGDDGSPGGARRMGSLEESTRLTMSWVNLEATVAIQAKKSCCRGGVVQEKAILQGASGIVKPGTLLAIMGASGAGKTTLLNVLTARNTRNLKVSGHIYANGFEIGSGIKSVSAYVQQDDLFIGTLSVREQLQFRALLRMDRQFSDKERLKRVEDVILEMGLTSCAKTRIGSVFGAMRGISGGERKRLSFASEALTNPPLMFCDEPTSGLDTFMAQNIINSLQKMAKKGHTILCTIHQPSSEIFAMFNQILIMSEGKTAFSGSSEGALEFFSRMGSPCPNNFNPADHYILTLAIRPGKEEDSRKKSRAMCDAFSSGKTAKDTYDEIEQQKQSAMAESHNPLLKEIAAGDSRYSTSWFKQARYLFWRSWITQFRDVILFRIRMAQSVINALILGLIYLQLDITQKGVMDINGAIFVLIISISFSNMFAVINSFPIELGIFMREYGSSLYRTDVYFLCKTLSELPMFLMTSVIFVTIAYWMIGLEPQLDTFLMAELVYFLTATCGVSLGYFISTVSGSVTAALAIAPPTLIPFMLFGGLFINQGNIPIYFDWLKYLSWFRYANEVLMVNQWKDIDSVPCPNATAPSNTTMMTPPTQRCPFYSGDDVLDYTSFEKDRVNFDIGMLCVLLVGFRLFAFIALLIRARRSKE